MLCNEPESAKTDQEDFERPRPWWCSEAAKTASGQLTDQLTDQLMEQPTVWPTNQPTS